jgi:2-oxoglutarate ferredoxin oxidoreductase subunit beta
LHVFAFGGDGDAFSIGGNHINHAARKNIKMTYVIMDNCVYSLTKKQTSPTSPIGYKSKSDTWGAVDRPINPMKQLLAAGATFVARTTSSNPAHILQMLEAAMDHDGFSVIECLSECVEFYPGAFDAANPRKGGVFNTIPADHDVTDAAAAYKLADAAFPGYFGIFYKTSHPTKQAVEAKIISNLREKNKGLQDWEILQKTFDRMK